MALKTHNGVVGVHCYESLLVTSSTPPRRRAIRPPPTRPSPVAVREHGSLAQMWFGVGGLVGQQAQELFGA